MLNYFLLPYVGHLCIRMMLRFAAMLRKVSEKYRLGLVGVVIFTDFSVVISIRFFNIFPLVSTPSFPFLFIVESWTWGKRTALFLVVL